jgi:hypothetical protein
MMVVRVWLWCRHATRWQRCGAAELCRGGGGDGLLWRVACVPQCTLASCAQHGEWFAAHTTRAAPTHMFTRPPASLQAAAAGSSWGPTAAQHHPRIRRVRCFLPSPQLCGEWCNCSPCCPQPSWLTAVHTHVLCVISAKCVTRARPYPATWFLAAHFHPREPFCLLGCNCPQRQPSKNAPSDGPRGARAAANDDWRRERGLHAQRNG